MREKSLPLRTSKIPEIPHLRVPSLANGFFPAKRPLEMRSVHLPNQLQQDAPNHRHPVAFGHLLSFYCNKHGPEVILVKNKPIFAPDFEKGRGLNLPVPTS